MGITTKTHWGDLTAISLSGLCLVHCLALPVLASLLPLAGTWTEAEWAHWAFAFAAAPVSLWTLTRRPAGVPMMLGAAGLILLFMGAAEIPSHEWETLITITGGLLLSIAHVLNWRHGHH